MAVVAGYVEIVNLAEAVTALLQRIGQHADAIFAHVKGISPEVGRARITVWDEHVRK